MAARSIDTIFQEIQTEKNTMSVINTALTNNDGTTSIDTEQDLLDRLQSNNKVSIWKLWAFVSAVQLNFTEQRWDQFKEEVEIIKDATPVYNKQWWSERALEFQTGSILEINPDDNSIQYPVIDTNAQIIGNCAVTDLAGKVILKIRHTNNSNVIPMLELGEFTTYINTLKPVGDRVIINNLEPDNIKLYYNIYYNSLVTTVQSDVESTINDYLDNLGFDSNVNINTLTNLLQELDGVVDPVFLSGEGKHGATAYTSIYNYYDTVAGYAIIDPLFQLSTTINYITKY